MLGSKLPLEFYMASYVVASADLTAVLVENARFRPGKRKELAQLIGVLARACAFDVEQVIAVTLKIWGEEQETAFGYLNKAIAALAGGDLAHRISSPTESDFPERYASPRSRVK